MKRSPSGDKDLLGMSSRPSSRIRPRTLGLLVLVGSFLSSPLQRILLVEPVVAPATVIDSPVIATTRTTKTTTTVPTSRTVANGGNRESTTLLEQPPHGNHKAQSTSSDVEEEEEESALSMGVSFLSNSSSSSYSSSSSPISSSPSLATSFHHLLSVPFYIYPGWGVSSWPNATLKMRKKEFDISGLDPEGIPVHSRNERKTKHADDYYMAVAARTHPMRTMDPAQAQLFLVPTPFNLLHERFIYSHKKPLCLEDVNHERIHKICNRAFIARVNSELGQSKWFQRHQGKDHIVIISHWMWTHLWKKHVGTWNLKHIHKCNAIDWEGKLQENIDRSHRITFPSYYVGKACSPIPVAHKTQDFAMVTTLVRSDINMTFWDRMNICNWIQQKSLTQEQALALATPPTTNMNAKASTNALEFKMEICGIGHQCPTLSQARFGFHAVGDTPGSNRPMDLLLSHTIPIFTRKEQYDVLPKWIDWDQISYFADVSNQTLFLQQLRNIVSDQETYQQKQQAVERNSDLFNYETVVPFDTYMYMFQSKLFPETIRLNSTMTSPYSALILP
jgi:hypothetical protein